MPRRERKDRALPKKKATTKALSPKERLRDLIPRAGLILPYNHQVLRRSMADKRIVQVLAQYKPVPSLTRQEVEPVLAEIFSQAKILLAQDDLGQFLDEFPPDFPAERLVAMRRSDPASVVLPIGGVSFLFGLKKFISRQSSQSAATTKLVRRMPFKIFAGLFLVLRSARIEWMANPRPPFDKATHSVLPTEIESFLEASRIVEWGGMEMILWLRNGEMWLDEGHGNGGPTSNNDDNDDEDDWDGGDNGDDDETRRKNKGKGKGKEVYRGEAGAKTGEEGGDEKTEKKGQTSVVQPPAAATQQSGVQLAPIQQSVVHQTAVQQAALVQQMNLLNLGVDVDALARVFREMEIEEEIL